MQLFKKYKDKTKCWWCGSRNLSREHKYKKTDLELLYGKDYTINKKISKIAFRTERKGKFLQSSSSTHAKFRRCLCIDCNGRKSQNADKAYQKLIEYYYDNQIKLIKDGEISLRSIFSNEWEEGIRNVHRYIAKHIGCRIAELGFLPSKNLIDFLNGNPTCEDLKIVLQIKPYQFGEIENPIECIFLGPFIPVNCSPNKNKDVITSFLGWYTFVNFSWNYLHEPGIGKSNMTKEIIKLDIIDFKDSEVLEISLKEETFERDWALGLEKIEYYPFLGNNRDLDLYDYIKNYV
ncbi:hypothetical protein [Membranihabitans marinus]|uniref:hypothetical protein n=1 Tax=Membranihabitans marinus TaxID=1227546 RepID=UPI001F42EB5C|nr:hypothetical protein [Membranihabitans marinus]